MKFNYEHFTNVTVDPTRQYVPATDGYVIGAIMKRAASGSIDSSSALAGQALGLIRREIADLRPGDVVVLTMQNPVRLIDMPPCHVYTMRQNSWCILSEWDPTVPPTKNRFHGDPGFMTSDEYNKWCQTVACTSLEMRQLRAAEHLANQTSDHVHSNDCRDSRGNTLKCDKSGRWPTRDLVLKIVIKVDETKISEFFSELGEVLNWWDSEHEITSQYVKAPAPTA